MVKLDKEEEEAAEKRKIGDHIATVYTQVPKDVNSQMKALGSQLLEIEPRIMCSRDFGQTSRV